MNELISLDHQLFQKINSSWTSAWADQFFPFITDLHQNPWFIAMMVVFVVTYLFMKKVEGAKWIVALIITLAATDMIAYRIVKPFVERPRPPASGVPIIIRGITHTGNSFPSNHATNIAAAATVVFLAVPQLAIPVFLFALVIDYSRVYVGAHFPLDVIGGSAMGILIALAVYRILRSWLKSDGYFSHARKSDQLS